MNRVALEEQALRLSPADRAILAENLLQSLESPSVVASWIRESADRVAAYDRGEIRVREAEAVLASIRAELS